MVPLKWASLLTSINLIKILPRCLSPTWFYISSSWQWRLTITTIMLKTQHYSVLKLLVRSVCILSLLVLFFYVYLKSNVVHPDIFINMNHSLVHSLLFLCTSPTLSLSGWFFSLLFPCHLDYILQLNYLSFFLSFILFFQRQDFSV